MPTKKEAEYLGRTSSPNSQYIKDDFSLIDDMGNKISYQLQSVKYGEGYDFCGYMVGIMNIACEDSAKLLNSALKYFAAHPEKAPTGALGQTKPVIMDTYMKDMIEAAIESRRSSGKTTSLERAYAYQKVSDQDNGLLFSFKQLTGETDLFNKEQGQLEILADKEGAKDAQKLGKYMEDLDRAMPRLKDKMKNDASKASNASRYSEINLRIAPSKKNTSGMPIRINNRTTTR